MLNNDSGLMALDEMPYDSEKLLQELLAKHGDLLAGEQIDSDEPRRWLLVTREMSVQGEFSNAARWSLDHLFATGGWVAFRFDSLYKKLAFRKESVRRVLLDKINEIPGVHFGDEVLTKRARVPFDKLNSSEAIEKTKSALAWIIQQIHELDAADETAE